MYDPILEPVEITEYGWYCVRADRTQVDYHSNNETAESEHDAMERLALRLMAIVLPTTTRWRGSDWLFYKEMDKLKMKPLVRREVKTILSE